MIIDETTRRSDQFEDAGGAPVRQGVEVDEAGQPVLQTPSSSGCALDNEILDANSAPLFTDKRNFWVLMLKGVTTAAQAQNFLDKHWDNFLISSKLDGQLPKKAPTITGAAYSPAGVNGNFKLKLDSRFPLNADWAYVAIEFAYAGHLASSPNWPRTRSTLPAWLGGKDCPEQSDIVLYAVAVPAPLPIPEPTPGDILSDTVKDVTDDAKGALSFTLSTLPYLVGAAVGLMFLRRK